LLRSSQFLFSTIWDKPAVLVNDSKSVNLMMQGLVHRLTGRDFIGVEYKHGSRFVAEYQGVVWVTSNQKPNIEDNRSNRSRLTLLTIRPGEWVDALGSRLRLEMPALLAAASDAYASACPRHFEIALNEESLRLLEEATGHESDKFRAALKVGGFVFASDSWVPRSDLVSRTKLTDGETKSFYAWLRRQPGVKEAKRGAGASAARGFEGIKG
jgi:hypothetical protein